MANVFQMKEACVFVGGNGTKAGSVKAGGCTRTWLESKGMNPSSLFGPNGSCIFQDTSGDMVIGMTGVVNGSIGQFAGIEPGMVARLFWSTTGLYEVTAVGSQGLPVKHFTFLAESSIENPKCLHPFQPILGKD